MQVLDKGFVELIDHMGSDLSVVNGARISMGKRKEVFDDKDSNLIDYLAEHDHTSPFRIPHVVLHIKAPIFVMRQWMRYKIGCLAGDSEIHFERTHGRKSGTRRVRIDKLFDVWTNGNASANVTRKHSGKQDYKTRIGKMQIRCLDESTGEFSTNNIRDVVYSGVKKAYKITLDNGKSLTMTDNHRVWTNDGWAPIAECVNSLEDFSYCLKPIACNGKPTAGDGRYRSHDYLRSSYEAGKTLKEMAEECGCSIEAVKKWCYRLGIPFVKEDSRFKAGGKPWNAGLRYKIRPGLGNRKNLKARRGPDSNFWRGGVTTERAKIAAWTISNAPRLHRENGYKCALCGAIGGKLHAHHIIPVSVDASLGMEYSNLATVCHKCHRIIHATPQSEAAFANGDPSLYEMVRREYVERQRKTITLKPTFHYVVAVEPVGEIPVYDITLENSRMPSFIANGIVVHNSDFNEISGRYVEFEPEYYVPEVFRTQSKDVKQGSDGELVSTDLIYAATSYKNACEMSFAIYNALIANRVAKEQARMVLPLALYTEVYWTASLQAVAHFLNQRLDPHAQWEIREYAKAVKELVLPLYPHSLTALLEDK